MQLVSGRAGFEPRRSVASLLRQPNLSSGGKNTFFAELGICVSIMLHISGSYFINDSCYLLMHSTITDGTLTVWEALLEMLE